MADNKTKEQRSYNMSRIRSKNTTPEITVRKFLFSHGLRFRLHDKKLPGKPDIVLKKYNTVIFINGCFWHGHEDCNYYRLPKSNIEYWSDKIEKNIKKDAIAHNKLKEIKYNVIVIWECQIKDGNFSEFTLDMIKNYVSSSKEL